MGEHFLNTHGVAINLKDDKTFENNVMKHFKLTILASVEPGQPWSLTKLDQLEGDFQKKLMCMDYNAIWVLGCVVCAIFSAVWIMGSVILGCVVRGLGGLGGRGALDAWRPGGLEA